MLLLFILLQFLAIGVATILIKLLIEKVKRQRHRIRRLHYLYSVSKQSIKTPASFSKPNIKGDWAVISNREGRSIILGRFSDPNEAESFLIQQKQNGNMDCHIALNPQKISA